MSHRQIAKSLSVSTPIVSVYSVRATSLGIVSWTLPDKWDDESLERAFFKKQTQPKKYALPDWPVIHQGVSMLIDTLKDIIVITIFVGYTKRGENVKNYRCGKHIKQVKNCLLITVVQR
jgi:hypothetical protein